MKKLLLLIALAGCSTPTAPTTQTTQATRYVIVPMYGSNDTITIRNGSLDSELTSNYGNHVDSYMPFVDVIPSGLQVFLPSWTPFAFQHNQANTLTWSWNRGHDTLACGNYYKFLQTGYSNGGLKLYAKQ